MPTASATIGYADAADMILPAPLIVDAVISGTTKLPADQAIGVPPSIQRLLVEADVTALIRGQSGITPRIRFLFDLHQSADGKFPKIKKMRFFIMGNYTDKPGNIRLVSPSALIPWSTANDARVRAITREAVMLDAPQKILGISSAFYSSGAVTGEGESQIFLSTEKNQPLAISVSSAKGTKKWSVSTSELIEESASAPATNSLLWYRLACELPAALPASAIEAGDADSAKALATDYAYVLGALGPCGRRK